MDHDMLSSLLSDPQALQNAMKTVSGMLGGGESAASPPPKNDYDPSAELMERAIPVISTIVQSSQDAVKREKRELLNAVKPFVPQDIAGQFDHAMRLVSIARMARAALGQLGGSQEEALPENGTKSI